MENQNLEKDLGFYSLFFNGMPMTTVLPELLKDRTTGKNIVWSTMNYASYGAYYLADRQITPESCLNLIMSNVLVPRVEKTKVQQEQRTREKAEVFTPSWIVNKMNNFCDEQWFMRKDVFNTENEEDHTWTPVEGEIGFPRGRDAYKRAKWQQYVDSRRCEITCGEAPYMVSRYDATTGEFLSLSKRVGFLDRKLRVIGENAATHKEWLDWTYRAYQASYGYEYQGDSLFLARVNLVQTFIEYYRAKWQKDPTLAMVRQIVDIVTWNVWQMNGLLDIAPCGVPEDGFVPYDGTTKELKDVYCRIKDWRSGKTPTYHSLKGGKRV